MHETARSAAESDGLEAVIATAELSRRAARAPDYAAESGILASLAQGMTRPPELILQSLAQAALTSCRAGSAGISLIEADGTHFRWRALTGELAPHLGDTTPREFSPCGTVVDRNSVHLFHYLERHFKYFAAMRPTIVEALLVPFSFEGKPVGTIWVMTHDDAHRFDAEDARLIGNLGRFAAAAYQVRCALAQAEEANRHRDECLEILSHELRNPLFPMQLIADLLVEEPVSLDDVKRASGVMQRQVKHLQHLVGDLKDVASSNRGALALRQERGSLCAVVEQAIEASRPLVERAGHVLCVALPGVPVFVNADPVRLAQVIGNLLSNAVKFTARGGHLRVSVEARDAHAWIRVQDDGIGIEPDMLDTIFALYAQLRPSVAGAEAGAGIGLALARSLVEMHGGTITANSAGPGKGSEFAVSLPLADPAQAASATPPKDGNGKLRVLVVDDHRDTADALAWVLQNIGHEVRTAYDAASAIRACEELSPQVIFQDLLLPSTGGAEIAREIRKRPALQSAVLVAMTGAANAAALRAAERDAFDHLIVKPVGLKELNDMLGKAASRMAPPDLSAKADRSNAC
jgi:signal transduction histidine kinase/ActR/RegA family two-component response regulator